MREISKNSLSIERNTTKKNFAFALFISFAIQFRHFLAPVKSQPRQFPCAKCKFNCCELFFLLCFMRNWKWKWVWRSTKATSRFRSFWKVCTMKISSKPIIVCQLSVMRSWLTLVQPKQHSNLSHITQNTKINCDMIHISKT